MCNHWVLWEISYLFGIVSRKELQVSWFGYKNDAALAGLSGLKTNEAKLAGALNVQSLGAKESIDSGLAFRTVTLVRFMETSIFSSSGLGSFISVLGFLWELVVSVAGALPVKFIYLYLFRVHTGKLLHQIKAQQFYTDLDLYEQC